MKVRLTVHRPDLGKVPGDVITLESERALRLIQAGQAEAVPETAEAAVTESGEQAVIPEPVANRPKSKRS